jgi:hypothetical protein
MRPTIEQLKRAIEIREQIDRLEKELAEILGGAAVPESASPVGKRAKVKKARKRYLSPEARARIAAAQRERWQRQKAMQQQSGKTDQK